MDSTKTPSNFSWALDSLKSGHRVKRLGWNGKDMFIFLVDGSEFEVNRAPLNKFYEEGTRIKYHSHIDMKTADGQIMPWLASQADVLSDDWVLALPQIENFERTCLN